MRTPEEAASHIEALELRLVGAEDVILHQHKRIEALEAALRKLADAPMHDTAWGHVMQMRAFARDVLLEYRLDHGLKLRDIDDETIRRALEAKR